MLQNALGWLSLCLLWIFFLASSDALKDLEQNNKKNHTFDIGGNIKAHLYWRLPVADMANDHRIPPLHEMNAVLEA